jgi:hypothetical protein
MAPESAGADILIMDADEKWVIPAKVLDISAHGGLIGPGVLVGTGRRLRVLFDNVPEAGWIEAEVVRGAGPGQVGMRFLSPLSPGFVRAAASEARARRYDPESETPDVGRMLPTW